MRSMLSIAFAQSKPGTGKTTSAVWLCAALHARGLEVVLVDADPAASALQWSDLAGGFGWRVVGLPVRDLHRRVRDAAHGADVVVADVPQIEDHAGIARSAMRWAREVVVPVAPAGVELDRMAPIRKELDALDAVRREDARWCVLLNRTVSQAASVRDARDTLRGLGDDVLSVHVPRLERYATSFGLEPDPRGTAYDELATVLLARDGGAA